jgi:hypothetical protein
MRCRFVGFDGLQLRAAVRATRGQARPGRFSPLEPL